MEPFQSSRSGISSPADLPHADRVRRVGRDRLGAFGDGGASGAVDGPDPLSPRGELAYDHSAGGAAAPDDDVEFVRFGHQVILPCRHQEYRSFKQRSSASRSAFSRGSSHM